MSHPLHETLTQSPVVSEASDGIEAAALRAQAWAGEPFLRPEEDTNGSAQNALRPGTALRYALDSALAEIEAGLPEPSSEWKVRFGLMLGLERVLSEKPPHLASGTELRRHQVDALAGMLTELIAANEKQVASRDGAERRRARARRTRRTTRRTTTSLPAPRTRTPPDAEDAAARDDADPAPSAATASVTRRPPGRRSPRPGSSRPPAPRACSS